MSAPLLRALLVLALVTPLPALAAKGPAPAAAAPAPRAAGLVIAARTGPEDTTTLSSAFRHARVAKESGHLAEVTVVVYGRAIVVFDPAVTLPDEVRAQLHQAKAAGVRLVACKTALERFGVPVEAAAQLAEVTDQGMGEIARLVSLGHEVMSY
jgi:intracellular sulfur oxidation DsrE/DsrF family protein